MNSRVSNDVPPKSKEVQVTEDRALEQQSEGSEDIVYDFIYHDARRIGSFLAQFQTYGLTQAVTATEGVAQTRTNKTGLTAEGSVPLFAKGQGTINQEVADVETDTAQYSYDPLWTYARKLLSALNEQGLIENDISVARIGQFVELSGKLNIVDMTIANKLISIPAIKNTIQSKFPKAPKGEIGVGDIFFPMLSVLPQSIHASLKQKDLHVWSILTEENLSISASSLYLKHGTDIQGTWSMLGILDALPDKTEENKQSGELMKDFSLTGIVETAGPVARSFLGRPDKAYGMTPLMIYREVSAK